ncbi:hypothetical protein ACOBQX_02060 [Actinokineospora sp. G85]|uniref:hypothetical protein n=1 Tax=Actinokineospora sp. G85 TaxID=3406626 RepID=UPI003C7191A0
MGLLVQAVGEHTDAAPGRPAITPESAWTFVTGAATRSLLRSLVETGEVDAVRSAAGEVCYRRCLTAGHDHLVCRL